MNRNFKNLAAIFGMIAACVLFYFAILRWDVIAAGWATGMDILKPIIYGIVMAYLLNPVMCLVQPRVTSFLQDHMSNKERAASIGKGIGIASAIVFGVAVVSVVVGMIVPDLYTSLKGLIETLPGQIKTLVETIEVKWEISMDAELKTIWNTLKSNAATIFDKFYNKDLLSVTGNVLTYLTTGVIGVVGFVFDLFIGIMTAIFALGEKEKFIAQSKKVVFALFRPEMANNILDVARHCHKVFGGFLIGKIIDSIIIGIICYVCMLWMKMPYPLLIGIFIGLTNIVPIFGPFIGAIPSVILILLVSPIKAVYFAIFILILQQIDGNIIGPTILGDTTGLDEFWVILALILCGGLWGIVGMIIGVPLFATLYYVAKRLLERILRNKGLPVETEHYRDVECYDGEEKNFVLGVDETLKRRKEEEKKQKKEKKNKKKGKSEAGE